MKALIRILVAALALAYGAMALAQAFVVEIRGSATLQSGTGPAEPLVVGQKIPPGALLHTLRDSMVVLGFPDKQVCVIGQISTFRIVDYRYEPGQADKGEVHLNLIDGSLRIAVGEIGTVNPGAIRVQIGVATMGVLPSAERADASVVVLGGPVSVIVQEGRAVILLPSSGRQEVAAGEGLFFTADGTVRRGDASRMAELLGQSADGKEMLKQFASLDGMTLVMQQTVITLATVFGGDRTDMIPPPPALNSGTTAGTAGTGSGGGGNIASPN